MGDHPDDPFPGSTATAKVSSDEITAAKKPVSTSTAEANSGPSKDVRTPIPIRNSRNKVRQVQAEIDVLKAEIATLEQKTDLEHILTTMAEGARRMDEADDSHSSHGKTKDSPDVLTALAFDAHETAPTPEQRRHEGKSMVAELRLPVSQLGKRTLPSDEAREVEAGIGEVGEGGKIRPSKSRKESYPQKKFRIRFPIQSGTEDSMGLRTSRDSQNHA